MPEDEPAGANRRRYRRIAVPLTEAQATHLAERHAARFRVRIADLSAGGARLFTNRPLNPDDALYVHLPRAEDRGALNVPARVVWVQPGDGRWEIGIQSRTALPSPVDGAGGGAASLAMVSEVEGVRLALAGLLRAAHETGDSTLLHEGLRLLRDALHALEAGELLAGEGDGRRPAAEPDDTADAASSALDQAVLTRAILVPGSVQSHTLESGSAAHRRFEQAVAPLVQAAYEQSRAPWSGDIETVMQKLRLAGVYIPRVSRRA